MVLWLLGYPERALVNLKNSLAHAEGVDYLYLRAFTLLYAVQIHLARRETHKTKEHLEALMTLATEQRFMGWLAYGRVWQGALQVEAGQPEGLALIRDGLDLFDAQGTVTHRPFLLGFYASAQHRTGLLEPALETFDEALAQVETTGERWWEAELHRLRGELLLSMNREEAAAHFYKAIAVAQAQEAKSLELRATFSLARLLRKQGEGGAARTRLAEVYGWFTEGLDTGDLLRTRALLENLPSLD